MVGLIAAPPRARSRAAGGLLGVAGGEAWQGHGGFEHDGPVTSAMLALAASYTGRPGKGHAPAQVAERHAGVPGPGWLLPAAVLFRGRRLAEEVRALAAAAEAPADERAAYVRWATLAAELFAAVPARTAIEVATASDAVEAMDRATLRTAPDRPSRPRLCGIAAVDAVSVGVWAMGQPRHHHLADAAPWIAEASEPWVAAAALGLLGLRDGCAGIPAEWHRCVRVTAACLELAPALQDATPAGEPDLTIAS